MSLARRISAASAVVAIVAAAVVASGCSDPDAIARVNGKPISRKAALAQLEQIKAASPAAFQGTTGKEREAQLLARIVQSLIQVELLAQAADGLGVAVTDKAVIAYEKRTETQYGGAAKFDEVLKEAGTDREANRIQVRSRLLVEAVTKALAKKRTFTDAEVAAYYEANKALFIGRPELKVFQVVVATQDKALASEILAKVKKGDDIGALAKRHSIDTASKVVGGEMEWAEAAKFDPAITEALSDMKTGEVRLVSSRQGLHVIRLAQRREPEPRDPDKVRAEILKILQQTSDSQAFTQFVEKARAAAKIEILDAAVDRVINPPKTGAGSK
jgi:parvulin-like peptidyl-prolyl isomerase